MFRIIVLAILKVQILMELDCCGQDSGAFASIYMVLDTRALGQQID